MAGVGLLQRLPPLHHVLDHSGLIIFLKVLELAKVTDLIGWLLSPLLRLMGISKAATPITMVGVLLGLSYGGGLIIKEAQEGKMSSRDVVLSLSFMGICHGLIEDRW